MVLGGEDVARAPSDLGSQSVKGLNQTSGLDGHVKRSRNFCSLEGFGGAVLLADGHETRHFDFSEVEFFSSPAGLRDVLDLRHFNTRVLELI